MKITYANEKEREYFENDGFEKSNKPVDKIVRNDMDYWIGFTVKDENRANVFVYDLIAAMNDMGDPEKRIDTDFIGIKVTEIGIGNPTANDGSDKIRECIDILNTLL